MKAVTHAGAGVRLYGGSDTTIAVIVSGGCIVQNTNGHDVTRATRCEHYNLVAVLRFTSISIVHFSPFQLKFSVLPCLCFPTPAMRLPCRHSRRYQAP